MTHRFAIWNQLLAFCQSIHGSFVFLITHFILVWLWYLGVWRIILHVLQELRRRLQHMRQFHWVPLEESEPLHLQHNLWVQPHHMKVIPPAETPFMILGKLQDSPYSLGKASATLQQLEPKLTYLYCRLFNPGQGVFFFHHCMISPNEHRAKGLPFARK